MKWSRLLCISDLSSFFTTPALCLSFGNLLQVIFLQFFPDHWFLKWNATQGLWREVVSFYCISDMGRVMGKSHWVHVPFFPEPLKKLYKMENNYSPYRFRISTAFWNELSVFNITFSVDVILYWYFKGRDVFIWFSGGDFGSWQVWKSEIQLVFQDLFSMRLCWLTFYIYP